MATIRHKEFVDFAKNGGTKKFGALKMKGDHVHSYCLNIGIVDRFNKVIKANFTKRSRTTSNHQNSIRNGFYIFLEKEGWILEEMT